MKLFMKVVDNQLTNSIESERSIKQLFPPEQYPQYDYTTTLPPDYYPVETLPQPHINAFQKRVLNYEFLGDRVRDVWSIREMTAEEIVERWDELNSVKPYPSWILDEISSEWYAPIPMPQDGQSYTWDEDTKTWVLST